MSVAAALAVLAGIAALVPRVAKPSVCGRAVGIAFGPRRTPQHSKRATTVFRYPSRALLWGVASTLSVVCNHVYSNSADVDLLVDALRSLAGVAETGPGKSRNSSNVYLLKRWEQRDIGAAPLPWCDEDQ